MSPAILASTTNLSNVQPEAATKPNSEARVLAPETLENRFASSKLQQANSFENEGKELDVAANPRAFFKKGRVFMTLWTETSQDTLPELAQFAVIKPKPTFSVCLRISTYSGAGTTKAGVVASDHAAIVPLGGDFSPHPQGEHMEKDPIEVKVEDPEVTIDPMSRINFAKPHTVEHNAKIRNVGRVVASSLGLLDQYFAESLGHTKP
jgi:hypothetical protein